MASPPNGHVLRETVKGVRAGQGLAIGPVRPFAVRRIAARTQVVVPVRAARHAHARKVRPLSPVLAGQGVRVGVVARVPLRVSRFRLPLLVARTAAVTPERAPTVAHLVPSGVQARGATRVGVVQVSSPGVAGAKATVVPRRAPLLGEGRAETIGFVKNGPKGCRGPLVGMAAKAATGTVGWQEAVAPALEVAGPRVV